MQDEKVFGGMGHSQDLAVEWEEILGIKVSIKEITEDIIAQEVIEHQHQTEV